MNILQEIKSVEKQEAELAQKKKELLALKKEAEAQEAKLETLVKNSGFKSPRELVEALIEKYGLRLGGRTATEKTGKRRKRTLVTKELRDLIKKDVQGGISMNAASKKHKVSYIVVAKIMKGGYDKLA